MNLQKKGTDLFAYWKDSILFVTGLLLGAVPLLSSYYLDLYTNAQNLNLPTSLLALFTFVMIMVFWPLATITWSMMSAFPFAGSWYPQDPVQWPYIQFLYKKYRKYLFIGLAANVIFFICLAGFAYYSLAQNTFSAVFDEITSDLIFCFWMIMMCAMVIVFAVREISRE